MLFATKPATFAGFCVKISSAFACEAYFFESSATNTDAPEPLILALPYWPSHFKVDATAGNSLQTITSRSFLNTVEFASLEKSAIFNGFVSLVNVELAKT